MAPAYHSDEENLTGVLDPDFLALGLGGTNMMAMLWAVAMGRRAVGVEMRGDPHLGVHWNIRVDLYHQLGLIDQMMLERYGREGIPLRSEGRPFKLADLFYSLKTVSGDIVPDEIIDGYDKERHIVGTIHHVEFIDDRWRGGVPNRVVTLLTPPKPPDMPEAEKIRTNIFEVLDGPSTFQTGASAILTLLRRYLERMEKLDLESGRPPRVRLFTRHRVVQTDDDGFLRLEDGRLRVRIEALQEFDFKGKFVRVRLAGSKLIDIGTPELIMIAQGFSSSDADRLGFVQEDVKVDHKDGRGPVVAQADFLAGLIEILVGGRLRRRISSEFDATGKEFWARQIAVGHEDDPEVGWVLVQVPDFKTFDPIEAGIVAAGTDMASPEYFAGYQLLVYDYYMEQCADILELPKAYLKKVQMVYGPKLFSLVERVGADAQVAKNAVVAGDSFGNGHFLTSGGAMTGMVGHSARALNYWRDRDQGIPVAQAIRTLADGIKEDTHAWLHVSAQEYSEAVPINFGAERIKEIAEKSGIDQAARAAAIDATRRARHSLLPLDPSDWRRLFLRNGAVHSAPLPELHAMHPALRAQRTRAKQGAKISVAFVAPALTSQAIRFIQAVLGQPGVRMGLVTQGSPETLSQSTRDRLAVCTTISNCMDSQQILAAVRGMSGPLGTPELLLGTQEQLQLPLAEVREALGIPGMGPREARTFRDKAHMKDLLREAGLPVARHRLVDDVEAGLAFAREAGYPLVVKPPTGSGGGSIYRVANEADLRGLLGRLAVSPGNTILCEEYVEGRECSFEVMSIGGVPAWYSATRFDPGPLHVLENPWIQWTVTLPREVDDPADEKVRQMGFAALRALGMGSGISHMEWFRRLDGSVAISEVASRPPEAQIVSLMGHAHGADMYRAWANAVVHGLFAPIPRQFAAGAAFLRGQGDGTRVARIHGWKEVERQVGPLVVEARIPEVGQPKSSSYEGEGYVLVKHAQTGMVDQALTEITLGVKVELA